MQIDTTASENRPGFRKAAAIASFGPFERQQIPFRTTIISDMIQNTAPHPAIQERSESPAARAQPGITSLRPSLSVCIKHRLILDRLSRQSH
jgi:hypothetical protein